VWVYRSLDTALEVSQERIEPRDITASVGDWGSEPDKTESIFAVEGMFLQLGQLTDAMPDEDSDRTVSTERDSPVGDPVVRGDPSVTGKSEAVEFDPDDPESLATATEIVESFAQAGAGQLDSLAMLRGAAACAVLVRGEGSYRAASQRTGEHVSVSFVRTWARVHDLPRSVRRHVGAGDIAPSTAKHIGRLTGTDRLHLAWAVIDHGLTVREVREIVSNVNEGESLESALAVRGYRLGQLTIELPIEEYCLLRRDSSHSGTTPGETIAELFRES
jgi:hypothetical protein